MKGLIPASGLRLASDFDAGALPQLHHPVDGIRPPAWLIDPETPASQITAYLEHFVGGTGTVDPSTLELDLQPRARTEVIDGYLTQRVHIQLTPTEVVQLSARTDADPEPADSFPYLGPVAILGTTAPATHPDNAPGRRLDEELADLLAGRSIPVAHAVAVAANHEWIDRVILADYANPSNVHLAAAVHLQPFLTRWLPTATGAGTLEVIDLTDPLAVTVVATAPAALRLVTQRCCPMIPDAAPGTLCKMHGGPWISRSITAAMRWETRRDRMIRALGCDTCGDGAIRIALGHPRPGGRSAVPIRPDTATPTRHDRVIPAPDR